MKLVEQAFQKRLGKSEVGGNYPDLLLRCKPERPHGTKICDWTTQNRCGPSWPTLPLISDHGRTQHLTPWIAEVPHDQLCQKDRHKKKVMAYTVYRPSPGPRYGGNATTAKKVFAQQTTCQRFWRQSDLCEEILREVRRKSLASMTVHWR